ncbi:MAG: glycosyltransferase [Bacteroidales bacterium]
MSSSQPLVSVIISTYNSSRFIIETLESIRTQTWSNVELIVTDDCSTDQTVALVDNWFNAHREAFSQVELITSPMNTGVSANANRGLVVARGEWIKFLGADDTLLPDCITQNMNVVRLNPDIRVLFSRVHLYLNQFEQSCWLKTIPGTISSDGIFAEKRTALSQYKMLLVSDRINFSPSIFINTQTLRSVGGFDEKYRLLEDYPLWLNLTRNGHKLYYFPEITVNYRQHEGAINNMVRNYLIKPNYFRTELFRKEYIYPYLPWDMQLDQRFVWWVSQLFKGEQMNRNRSINIFVYIFLTTYLNPFKYYIFIKKRAIKQLQNQEFYV